MKKDGAKQGEKLETIIIENIINNYIDLERSIVNQLKLSNKLHPTTTGSCREDVWLQLFDMIIPKKFVIEHSIFIIDSYRRISKEVDLAIIDNSYTPYIFQYGRLKYVPIEAVAAVVECKSTSLFFQEAGLNKKGKEVGEGGMTAWCNSISSLRTSRESIVRMAQGTVVGGISYGSNQGRQNMNTTQTSTRPIRILCGYETNLSANEKKQVEDFFDFVLIAREIQGEGKIEITTKKRGSLKEWYMELDHYVLSQTKRVGGMNGDQFEVTANDILVEYKLEDLEVKINEEKISLLSFNFQLNQLLMLINNPILFPHLAYAKMFKGEAREDLC